MLAYPMHAARFLRPLTMRAKSQGPHPCDLSHTSHLARAHRAWYDCIMTNQPIEEMTDRELRDAIRELRKQYRESKSVELQIRHDILMQELQEREN